MIESLQLKELSAIKWIQLFRNDILDGWFYFLSYFDTEYFYYFVIPVLWIGYFWKTGLRILILLIISAMINAFFKELWMLPRPCQIDPSVGLIAIDHFGMPSGAAQTSMLLGSLLIYTWRNRVWAWILGINYIFWVSLSRIYLGVHFFSDLVVGWAIGLLLFLVYIKWFPLMERPIKQHPVIAFIIGLIVLILVPVYEKVRFIIVFISLGLFILIAYRTKLLIDPAGSFWHFVIRSMIGLAGMIALYFIVQVVNTNLHFSGIIFKRVLAFSLMSWLTLLAPFLIKKMRLV